jgi:hypothetical protein
MVEFLNSLRIKHVIYGYFLINHGLYIINQQITKDFWGLMNSIYFSFVTSSSLGYGDITPQGVSKILVIFEVIFGLSVLSLFVSKLVTRKQELLLQSIYHTSFEQKSHNLRAGLYHLREGLELLMQKIENSTIGKNELTDGINLKLLSFYTHISELIELLNDDNHIKVLDKEKLILHLLLSLKTFNNLFVILFRKKISLNKDDVGLSSDLVYNTIDDICFNLKEKKQSINIKNFNTRIRKKNIQFRTWINQLIK